MTSHLIMRSPNGSEADRREYFREKQREHRRKERTEFEVLQRELNELQQRAQELQPTTRSTPPVSSDLTLSWQLIAATFRDESKRALDDKKSLELEAQDYHEQIASLQRIAESYESLPTAVSWSKVFRRTILPSEPRARRLAKEWLTLHMYRNTDAILGHLPTVDPAVTTFANFDIEFADPCVNVMEHSQELLAFPMRSVIDVLRYRLDSLLLLDPTQVKVENEGNTLYYRCPLQHDGSWNVLQAFFHEADRCIMVFRRVQQDEAEPGVNARQKHAMRWVDIRRMGPSQTIVRTFSVSAIEFGVDEKVCLDAVADGYGFQLHPHESEEAKLNALYEHLIFIAQSDARIFYEQLAFQLDQSMHVDTTL
ncbi:hypothetical protein LEN26_008658 [Aphanomyces euteiches]|nr:hypothetical protein LEN26_008658 [Aphanomyces euteiches]